MATFVFAMNQSLDGYVDHEAFEPGPELFRHFIAQTAGLSGSLYGRRMYEIMRYWDKDDPDWSADLREYAEAWRKQPKWVVSRTLDSVGPNATLVTGKLEDFARHLKGDVSGEVLVAGPELAHGVGNLGLIDEYHIYLRPVVLGRGKPYFKEARPGLRLVANDRVGEDALRLTYIPMESEDSAK